jgi:hypothetical protein
LGTQLLAAAWPSAKCRSFCLLLPADGIDRYYLASGYPVPACLRIVARRS